MLRGNNASIDSNGLFTSSLSRDVVQLSPEGTMTTVGKCKFSKGWLDNPKYKAWLVKDLKWERKLKLDSKSKEF